MPCHSNFCLSSTSFLSTFSGTTMLHQAKIVRPHLQSNVLSFIWLRTKEKSMLRRIGFEFFSNNEIHGLLQMVHPDTICIKK